jgi:hypothetical protein
VVLADPAAQTRNARLRFGSRHQPVALAVVPATGSTPAHFAVLQERPDGGTRVMARLLDGTLSIKQGFPIDPIDLEPISDLGSAPGPELALLGTGDGGAVTAVVFDPIDRTQYASIPFGTDPGVDLAPLRDEMGTAMLAVLQQRDGEAVVTLADPFTGAVLRTVVIPLAAALDLEPIPGNAGGADSVAALGLSGDGAPAAFVADPGRGRVADGPPLDAASSPIDLAVVQGFGPSGSALAALTGLGRFEAGITIWDPGSGEPLGTITIT